MSWFDDDQTASAAAPVALVREIPNEPPTERPPDPEPPVDLDPPAAANGHHKANGRHKDKPRDDSPPHDIDAERSLLGAVMLGNHHALALVDDSAFYKPAHGHIANALRTLITDATYLDPTTVADLLRARGLLDAIGGPVVIAECLAIVPASSAGDDYAAIVNRHWRARRLQHAGEEIALKARTYGPDAAWELLQQARDTNAPTSSVAWEDVSGVLTGEYAPMRPTMLIRADGQALIYPGLLHWLMGEPGKGKTWVALHITAEQLQAGQAVIYLDWEGNRQIIGERLGALGCTVEHLQLLHYLRPPAITRALADAIAAQARTTGATIAICDGVAKALARNDLNEDKAADVLNWLELVTTPLTEAGAAVLCLDHVTKDKDTRGLWPRGSGAKQGEVSGAAWVVKPKRAFSRHAAGEITLVQAKDREGHVGVDGDTVARLLITPTDAGAHVHIDVQAPTTQTTAFRPTRLMQTISMALESFNQEGVDPTGTALLKEIPGKREHKLIALQWLVDEGHVTHRPGPRNAILHTATRPYRELDDPNSDTYRPDDEEPQEDTRWDEF